MGGLEPAFALLAAFAWRKLGVAQAEAAFLLGRSAGWVAHAMEQHEAGERERREPHYKGPLPVER